MPRHTRPRKKRSNPNKISMNALVRRDKGVCHLCNKPVSASDRSRTYIDGYYSGVLTKNVKLAHDYCARGN